MFKTRQVYNLFQDLWNKFSIFNIFISRISWVFHSAWGTKGASQLLKTQKMSLSWAHKIKSLQQQTLMVEYDQKYLIFGHIHSFTFVVVVIVIIFSVIFTILTFVIVNFLVGHVNWFRSYSFGHLVSVKWKTLKTNCH